MSRIYERATTQRNLTISVAMLVAVPTSYAFQSMISGGGSAEDFFCEYRLCASIPSYIKRLHWDYSGVDRKDSYTWSVAHFSWSFHGPWSGLHQRAGCNCTDAVSCSPVLLILSP